MTYKPYVPIVNNDDRVRLPQRCVLNTEGRTVDLEIFVKQKGIRSVKTKKIVIVRT